MISLAKGSKTNQKQFDFSEIYIFGKYENFVKRVSNINELLNTIQNFSSLKKCHIEGIEATNSNFDSIVESIKRKPYDILDHRKVMFYRLEPYGPYDMGPIKSISIRYFEISSFLDFALRATPSENSI